MIVSTLKQALVMAMTNFGPAPSGINYHACMKYFLERGKQTVFFKDHPIVGDIHLQPQVAYYEECVG